MKTLKNLGECALVERLREMAATLGPPVPEGIRVGIGDDCAVTLPPQTPGYWDGLMTSDAVIEGVHFTPQADDAAVGHKALGRCLSDIAAMGGEPMWALVNLVAPPATAVARIDAVFGGLLRTATAYNTAVVGGDVTAGEALALHVFLAGRVPAGSAVCRSGARAGDVFCVTGRLGGAQAGHHLDFKPRVAEGAWLRAGGWATAMIDLSDGLGLDACRLLKASGCAGIIDLWRVPVAAAIASDSLSAFDHALFDGEDYELLFTVNKEKLEHMLRAWQEYGLTTLCTPVGRIIDGPAGKIEGLHANGSRSRLRQGYQHFA